MSILALAFTLVPGQDIESHLFVLTDVEHGVHVNEFEISAADLELPGDWSIRKRTLRGGKQEGVDAITLDNGAMRAVLLPTRGMSCYELRKGDVRIGWDSPTHEIMHPALIDLESRGGLGWLEGFNEWMVRCGLEFAGHPGTDLLVDNVGNETAMELSLHGKVGNLPAARVEIVIDRRPPHRLRVRGIVYEKFFYGPKLRLETEFSMLPGDAAWRIRDRITNLGADEQEFQIIYHTNYGAPLLQKGAVAVVPARSVTPMNGEAAKALAQHAVYQAPTPGFLEQVYLIEPYADDNGRTAVMLHNPGETLGASISWNVAELPYFTQWKNTPAIENGYVTGLEPGTGYPFNRRVERKHGRVPRLAPGAQRSFTLDFALHEGEDAVQQARSRIEAIQAGRPTELIPEPPEID